MNNSFPGDLDNVFAGFPCLYPKPVLVPEQSSHDAFIPEIPAKGGNFISVVPCVVVFVRRDMQQGMLVPAD